MPAPPPNLDLSRSQCPMPDALPRDALPIRFMIFKEVSLLLENICSYGNKIHRNTLIHPRTKYCIHFMSFKKQSHIFKKKKSDLLVLEPKNVVMIIVENERLIYPKNGTIIIRYFLF